MSPDYLIFIFTVELMVLAIETDNLIVTILLIIANAVGIYSLHKAYPGKTLG